MKIAAAYVRMSDSDQDLSPERQWEEIQTRAARDGFTVPVALRYEDQGRSGWKRKTRRPGFDKLRRDLDSGRLREVGVTRCYFWKANRLARRRLEQLQMIMDLEEAGIEPVATAENWPEDPKLRKAIQTLIALFDELYSDTLSEDVQSGMRSQARKGFWMHGPPPYGYRAVKAGQNEAPRLEPDPEYVPYVERLLEMRFKDRDGHRKIAERLTRERIPPPSRPDLPRRSRPEVWQAKHVSQILGSLVYTGAITWRPTDPHTTKPKRDPATGKEIVEILCEKAHPAIFSREVWEEEQRMRRNNVRSGARQNPIRTGERGLFTPWLRCGLCGAKVRVGGGGHRATPLWYYLCGANVSNRESCPGISVRCDMLDAVLLRAIESALFDEEGAERLIRASIEKLLATPEWRYASEHRRLTREEADISLKIERLVCLAEETGDVTELGARLRELRAQREQLRADLSAIPEPRPLPDPETVDIGAFCERIKAAWQARSVFEQRKALLEILDHVALFPDGRAIIRYRWNGSDDDTHQLPPGPPQAPMSAAPPSQSSSAGLPASMQGEPVARE
ncbi:MAG: recombinase family protein [Pseudomonadota bacterium]